MDSCLLCLERNKDLLESIEINSIKWQDLNITIVLEKHFWPLSTMQPKSWICLSCWQKVIDFHNFYLSVEEAHMTFGRIKLEEGVVEVAPKKEPINTEDNDKFNTCLEPEIIVDSSIYQVDMQLEQFDNIQTSNDDSKLNEDPLEKPKANKAKTRKNAKTKNLSETKPMEMDKEIKEDKTDEEISSDDNDNDDYMESSSEEEDFEEEEEELEENNKGKRKKPQKKTTQSKKQQKEKNKQDDNKFIAEHYQQMNCELCNEPFEDFRGMKKHFQIKHQQNGYLSCCSRKYYQRSLFVDHLQCHLNPDYFKCKDCGKVLSDRKNFQEHILRVHRPEDLALKHACDVCGKCFTKAYRLRQHKLIHLPEEERKFPCSHCGKGYGSSSLLKLHIDVVHLKKNAKICYICGKTLGNSAEYKAHMNKHEGIPPPVINCDVCGLRLSCERSLRLHKETQHPVGGKKDHPCPVCHKISPTARALKKHIITMHEKGCDHKCTMCDKAFRRPETLREHMATHTGNALYTCPWCPKTFNSNGNMHAHRKNVHPIESLQLKLQKYSKTVTPPTENS